MKIYVGLFLLLIICFPSVVFSDQRVSGSYCYSYGDKESLKEAREITRALATREAIESSLVGLASVSNVTDFQLKKDVLRLVSAGYLRNVKVLQHQETNNRICETIEGELNEKEVKELVEKLKENVTAPYKDMGKLGKWNWYERQDTFPFYTEFDWENAPSELKKIMVPSPPFPDDNSKQWVFKKNLEYPVAKVDSRLEQYSVKVVRVGYALMSKSKKIIDGEDCDVIELGCQIEVENKSRRSVFAYGGCFLFDKDSFLLASNSIVYWDQDETGILIPAKEKGMVRRSSFWIIDPKSTPYPTIRIEKLDYELFLRHDIFETIR